MNRDVAEPGAVRRIVADALSARPYSHCQFVERSVAAVITVESDTRFLPATLSALLRQSVLPGSIVIADCAGQTSFTTSFEVIPTSAAPMHSIPESQSVNVQVLSIGQARSFGQAVGKALGAAHMDPAVTSLWLLHDDSRPADGFCLEELLEARRNTPAASLLGAKQLDWQGERLHEVGSYAYRHRIASLVVDGEPDQEQYDYRVDVFAVCLAGALVPLATLRELGGIRDWFTSYAESADLCRRICRGGGRVVVVPRARIAHRRARFEGMRTRSGEAVDEADPINNALSAFDAWQRYRYTDVARLRWPVMWLLSLVASIGLALSRLLNKQPYEAWCELCLPWRALISAGGAWSARLAVAKRSRVSPVQLSTVTASRSQILQWRDRTRALHNQRNAVLLSPLVRSHLRMRAIRRWALAFAMSVVAFAVVAVPHWSLLGSLWSGGSLYSAQWLASGATLHQLAQAASTQWSWGAAAPVAPAPWLWVLLMASLLTGGHVSAASALIFFASAPLSALAFWALAGVFTRSDLVRVITGLLWPALGLAVGLYATANLPMLTVMVFLPAAFAFTFRAVGLYHTEDPIRPRASVQSSAAASLCFVPVVASQPQLLLPLVFVFLVFLVFVPRHRAMLLLMPIPAAMACAPTLVNVVRFASHGQWRQLFGDMTTPLVEVNGSPSSLNLDDVLNRAFGFGSSSGAMALGCKLVLAALALLAVAALVLPFALRVSRMMWVVMLSGAGLSVLSSRVAIALADDGPVAGSVLPGLVLALLAAMSCACLVAGGAVRRFVAMRTTGQTVRAAWPARVGRIALAVVLAAGVLFCSGYGMTRQESVAVSGSGLPMVALDTLGDHPDQRVLALHADSRTNVSYAVMRTAVGDLIDSSPAWRAAVASGRHDDTQRRIGRFAAHLLSNADDEAISSLVRLGFVGIFVVRGGADDQLSTNVAASDGTQSIVTNSAGTYYRLDAQPDTAVNTERQRAAQSSPWRVAWLAMLAAVCLLYVLVAIPRRQEL